MKGKGNSRNRGPKQRILVGSQQGLGGDPDFSSSRGAQKATGSSDRKDRKSDEYIARERKIQVASSKCLNGQTIGKESNQSEIEGGK